MLLPSEDYSKHLFTHCMLHFIWCSVDKVFGPVVGSDYPLREFQILYMSCFQRQFKY